MTILEMLFCLYISSGKACIKKKVSQVVNCDFFPVYVFIVFRAFSRLILSISTCFILEVLYKSFNSFLKLMTALECVVSLFSVVSFA